jgi:homoserine kinase type II
MRGKPCALVSYLSGPVGAPAQRGPLPRGGESLARLHLAGAGFPMRRENDLGQAAWAPMFASLKGEADGLKPGWRR